MSKYLMLKNSKLFKLELTQSFLSESTIYKKKLLDELIVHATDPIKHMRRMRMLAELCEYESQILQKIQNFTTDNVEDFNLLILKEELKHVCNRSA